MKKLRKKIPLYGDDKVVLTVLEDDNREAWLTPEQVEYLDSRYYCARYNFSLGVATASEPQSSNYNLDEIKPVTVNAWIEPL